MPVRLLTQSVLRWPRPEQVIQAVQAWARHQRRVRPSLLHWPLERLPLSCDALVLTPDELRELLAGDDRMARELRRDLRWLT